VTPTALRRVLEAAHWSQRGLADLLGVGPSSVRHWCSGRYAIPADLVPWLAAVAAWHEAHPPPRKERDA
jgi:transcriptional regulator with XRE-family HTH domain